MTPAPSSPTSQRLPSTTRGNTFVFSLTFALLAAGVFAICLASEPDMRIPARLLLGVIAMLILLLPARIAFVSVRRYRREGRWMPSNQERLANRARVSTDSAASKIVKSPYYQGVLAVMPMIYLAIVFRPGHKPLDHFDIGLVVFNCLLLVAQSFVRKLPAPTRR